MSQTIDLSTVGSATFNGTDLGEIKLNSVSAWVKPTSGWWGDRGVVCGGYYGYSQQQHIDYFSIASGGASTRYGALTQSCCGRYNGNAQSDGSRLVYIGGDYNYPMMEYITIATGGNALAFGLLSEGLGDNGSGCTDGTKAVQIGGSKGSTGSTAKIQYVTIQSPSTATDYGNSRLGIHFWGWGTEGLSGRGVFGAGESYQYINDYITLASGGTSSFFGNTYGPNTDGTTTIGTGGAGCSDGYRGVWQGSLPSHNLVYYISIDSTGNAQAFGNSHDYANSMGACSDGVTGTWQGGGFGNTNIIAKVTIASLGNSVQYGTLLWTGMYASSASGN